MGQKTPYVGGVVRFEPNPSQTQPITGGGQGQVYYFSPQKEVEDTAKEAKAEADASIYKLTAMRADKKRLDELGLGEPAKAPETSTQKPKSPPERYLVDPEGNIDVAPEGEGEYTYKDALIVSASRKGERGHFDEAIKLIDTVKAITEANRPATTEEKKKEFYVDEETGVIVRDAEQGDCTLAEARTMSASRQRALVPRSENVVTPEKLELMKRDMRDEVVGAMTEELKEVKRGLTPAEPESPFTIADNGDMELNPKAKLSLSDLLLYKLVNQDKNPPYKDAEGNVRPLPEFLELGRFERDEKRKDARNDALVTLFEEGRKELPQLAAGLRNMVPSKEAEEALGKGGWLGEGKPETGLKTSLCPECGGRISYANTPTVVTCPKCSALDFFGTPEQLKDIRKQLGGEPRTEKQVLPTLSEDTEEATLKEPSEEGPPPTSPRSEKKA